MYNYTTPTTTITLAYKNDENKPPKTPNKQTIIIDMLMVIGISLPINTCCLIQHLKALETIKRQFSLYAWYATPPADLK